MNSLFQNLCQFSVIILATVLPAVSAAAQSAAGNPAAVARINGARVITLEELDETIRARLAPLDEQIYHLRRNALNNLIGRILIEEEARARGLTAEDLIERLMPEKVRIDRAEVERKYREHAKAFAGMSEDEARERIRLDLEAGEKMRHYRMAVDDLRRRARIEDLLPGPKRASVNVDLRGPRRGRTDAPVVIAIFSDFQCPYCRLAAGVLDKLMDRYPDQLSIVYKHLPLPMHELAFPAARASVCADEQGRFWEYHDRLFKASSLAESDLTRLAGETGIDAGKFSSCLESDGPAGTVNRDIQQASDLDIHSTPTIIINGSLLRGLPEEAELIRIIEQAIREAKSGI
ncbi:MAG: thioredoxin domain-containing protein [Acidobacteriota bacterium]|nr:MAG: thioredoxin domain-containing protein [Acidobacteriota bacterium]